MDCTLEERDIFHPLAIEARAPTQTELDLYHAQVIIYEPDDDTRSAEEILSTSPAAITLPDIWELLRIIGRRLGYRFD